MSAVSTATLQEVGWKCPKGNRDASSEGTATTLSQLSRNALLSIQLASIAARDFDATYALRNVDRELSIPLFAGNEVVLESTQPIRLTGYSHEFGLHNLKIVMDLVMAGQDRDGNDSTDSLAQQRRRRLADRVSENPQVYSVKYLQKHLIDSDQGPEAACEMIVEAKILMNLSHPSHPNLLQVFGANGDGIDSFLESGRKSFFLIVDRLQDTLEQRLQRWREEAEEQAGDVADNNGNSKLLERLEVANDICSALVFLASRELVYYLRPDKVGFDARCGRVKLCEFGQARQEGMTTHSPGILHSTKSTVLAYTAPEVLCQSPATVSSDVYAFGIVLWELWSLQRPFHAYSKSDHWTRVIQNHERPTLPPKNQEHRPGQLAEIMQECWDPHFRPTIKKVQDDLETALLFDDLRGAVQATVMDPSSTRAVCSEGEVITLPKSNIEPMRGRRSGPNVIEQHLRRTASTNPNEPATSSPHTHSSGASVATHSTYRTRGDYSAFTHGPSSPTRSFVQLQRRRRSMSRGPAKSRVPDKNHADTATTGITLCDGSALVPGSRSAVADERAMRPRRLSMEIAAKPSRSRSVQRSRSMNIDGSSRPTKILTDALSQLEHVDSRAGEHKPISAQKVSPASDAPSTETLLTVPCSESTFDPVIASPVQRRRSSRRHPSSLHDNTSKNSPTGTAATSGSSSTESSPNTRTPSSSQSGSGIRAAQQRQSSVRRAESLRRLVQGDVFPDLMSPHNDASPVRVPSNSHSTTAPRARGVQRSQSLIMNHVSGSSSLVAVQQDTFSLDNIPQTTSPSGRATQNRRFSSSFQPQNGQPTRSVTGFDQRALTQQGLQSVNEYNEDCHRSVACDAKATDLNFDSPTSASASPPRRRMMSRTMSARDMPRRHHSYSHPQKDAEHHHDRRSLRAERTMVASPETGSTRDSFSARLRAEMAAEATAFPAAGVQDANVHNRVIRVRVRSRRNSQDA